MKQKLVIVTSYKNPDLDGVACSIAYAEFLKNKEIQVVSCIFGVPHREAQFVLRKLKLSKVSNQEPIHKEDSQIILVDASDLRGIDNLIDPNQVVEIIDHRKENQADKFRFAKKQIELVGSCATLIAEKFFKEHKAPSKASAILLYSAIVSNTVNFQASVTTKSDSRMAKWLLNQIKLPKNYLKKMFLAKSAIKGSLQQALESDFASFEFNSKKLGVAQLEIINATGFIKRKFKQITNALVRLKLSKKLDYIFLTIVDIDNSSNIFIVVDKQSERLLAKSLNVKFKDQMATKKGILMRKSLVSVLKKVFI